MKPTDTAATLEHTARTATLCSLQVQTMACSAPSSIDRVMLLLAGTFCATAARHLGKALDIISQQEASQ
jgi:hypothetical protein